MPGKNSRMLNNLPMIVYSIQAAQKAKNTGTILVTTDDLKIAEIAKKHQAEVPFIRPFHLSDDKASTTDVIFHALDFYKEQGKEFDYLVLLQPTSPLRTANDIDTAFKRMLQKNTESVVSVCQSEHHPLWSNTLPENDSMKDFIREDIKGKNRQQLPVYYRLNGALFISTTQSFYENRSFFHDKTTAYRMPAERSIDIDTEMDFLLAELLLKK